MDDLSRTGRERPLHVPPPPPREHRRRRLVGRLLAVTALAGFVVAAYVLVSHGLHKTAATTAAATTAAPPTTGPPPTAPKPKPKPVPKPVLRPIAAVSGYDPLGDQHENDAFAPRATDGNAATFWSTERYTTWFKKGVGLLLDLHRPQKLVTVSVTTDTPGFLADLLAGATPKGPFKRVALPQVMKRATVFHLAGAAPARYLVLWILRLGASPTAGGAVHVTEVHAAG